MEPLIRRLGKEPDEEKRKWEEERKVEKAAYARFLRGVIADTPIGNTPAWKLYMVPAGSPNPRQALIEDFKGLREWLEPPVPPDQRDFYGPPPSDPKDRLYEHKKKGLLGLEAGPNHSNGLPTRTTKKEQ